MEQALHVETVADQASATDIAALRAFMDRHPRLFVLTGAGMSTESGIPGYRDANGQWMRSAPVLWQEFLANDCARRRYWVRSMLGWPQLRRAEPNAAHRVLAHMQFAGNVARLVTQNVDGLHGRAGSRDVIELHGNLASVVCLACGVRHDRAS